MPLIGQVPARGRSTVELQNTITTKLAESYLRDPDITVEVSEYRPFFVHGAVKSAGKYPYAPGMTAETAIAVAGGFTVKTLLYQTLVRRDAGGRIVPGLASKWEFLDGGKSLLLTLQPDAVFHNDRPVDASVVEYSGGQSS